MYSLQSMLLQWDGKTALPAEPPEPADLNQALDRARAQIARRLDPREQMTRLQRQFQAGEIDDETYETGMERAIAEDRRNFEAALGRNRAKRARSEPAGAPAAPQTPAIPAAPVASDSDSPPAPETPPSPPPHDPEQTADKGEDAAPEDPPASS